MCGVTQVVLDTFVILQIFYYRRKNRIRAKTEGSNFENELEPGQNGGDII